MALSTGWRSGQQVVEMSLTDRQERNWNGVFCMILDGCIAHIVYHNEENGYTVLSLEVTGAPGPAAGENQPAADAALPDQDLDKARSLIGDTLTAVGTFPDLKEGEYVRLTGEMTVHSSYGDQLKCTAYEFLLPPDADAAERYLSSNIIKGIGPSMAKKIVQKFGDQTFEVIENEPERLVEIPGIGPKKARDIANSIMEKRDSRRAMMFLAEYGISVQLALKAYETYGNRVYSIIRENPYQLADEITGVGFRTADEIARKAGIRGDSEFRVRSGILYALQQYAINGGHTCVPMETLVRESAFLLDLPSDVVETQITNLMVQRNLVIKVQEGANVVYSTSYYYMELRVAQSLKDLNVPVQIQTAHLAADLESIEQKNHLELDEIQRNAVLQACLNGFMVITGGPGTGKTTTINTIIEMLEKEGMEVALAAPTGRAARRMKEATGREALTIHRLLEVNGMPQDNGRSAVFGRNEDTPLECDAVIVDEASMIDISLMSALVRAIPVGTRLILVGDVNQLPSVGPGNVLKDIIQSDCFTVVRLTKIFRQAEESDIIVNAHRINAGEMVEPKKGSKDFLFVQRDNVDYIQGATKTLLQEKLPKYLNVNANEIQVLAPMRKGPLGVEGLNQFLQQYLNPPSPTKREKAFGDYIFREGDKVMQVRNNYQLDWEIRNRYGIPVEQGSGIFNGDTGIIEEINLTTEELVIRFEEGRRAVYTFHMLEELEPAYAITIHKAQGSEYPAVILPLLGGPKMLMTRNLLYTAVTRAKNCVTVVGSLDTFQEMIRNETETRRYSGLKERIREFCNLQEA